MTAKDVSIDARDWSLLGVLSVLWGGSFFFNGVVLRELPPLTLVFLRVALAASSVAVAPALAHPLPNGISGWKPFFAIGLFNNVMPFSLIVVGQTYIPSGLASILNATTPLFTVIVMAVAGEEKLAGAADRGRRRRPDRRGHPARRWHWAETRAGDRHSAVPGGRLYTACRRWWRGGCRRMAAARHGDVPDAGFDGDDGGCRRAGRASLAAADAGRYDMARGDRARRASTALAYIVFFQILRRSGATNVMLVTLLIPVTAILLGWLVLGEQISPREIAGALVIGSALLLIDGRVLKFFQR